MASHQFELRLWITTAYERPRKTVRRAYDLRPLAGDGSRWELLGEPERGVSESYEVALDRWGHPRCTCRDFVCRRKGPQGETCKHIDALLEYGLLRAGVPASPAGRPA